MFVFIGLPNNFARFADAGQTLNLLLLFSNVYEQDCSHLVFAIQSQTFKNFRNSNETGSEA